LRKRRNKSFREADVKPKFACDEVDGIKAFPIEVPIDVPPVELPGLPRSRTSRGFGFRLKNEVMQTRSFKYSKNLCAAGR
jgi:hypothetical protein